MAPSVRAAPVSNCCIDAAPSPFSQSHRLVVLGHPDISCWLETLRFCTLLHTVSKKSIRTTELLSGAGINAINVRFLSAVHSYDGL